MGGLNEVITWSIFSLFLVELLIFVFSVRELSKLKIERKISKRRLFVGDTISSSIVMQNDGFRTIGLVKLSQDIPIEFKSLGKSKSYAINLAPGEKIKFEYEIFLADSDEILLNGYTIHACTNLEGKPVKMPKYIRKILQDKLNNLWKISTQY